MLHWVGNGWMGNYILGLAACANRLRQSCQDDGQTVSNPKVRVADNPPGIRTNGSWMCPLPCCRHGSPILAATPFRLVRINSIC
jgi:hypothetical protein